MPHDDATSEVSGTSARPVGNGPWFIETPALILRWQRAPSGDIQLASLRTPGAEWLDSPIGLADMEGDAAGTPSFHDIRAGADEIQLTGHLQPSGATIVTKWKAFPSTSVVMAELEILNETDGPIDVGSIATLRLELPRRADARLAVLAGGRWDEAVPPSGYRLQVFDLDEIGRGMRIGAADDGRSSGEHVPWFALNDDRGGVFVALVWSGRWALQGARRGDANTLSFGITDLVRCLAPGERMRLPSAVIGGYAGDLDDGANAWRRWVVDHETPPVSEGWPWLQYNHWYAYGGDIDAERLLAEVRLAADAGCEVFVIDDGRFRGRVPQ